MATTNYGWVTPTVAGDEDVWGGILNDMFETMDSDVFAVSGVADAAMPKAGGTFTGLVHIFSESYTVVNKGSMSGVVDFDLANGNIFYGTLADAISTLTFSNPPASGKFGGFILEITNGGAFSITWPSSVDWPGGTEPGLTAAGVDFLYFFTRDGGTTWHGALVREDSK